jgi:phage/conjugal plasmid C-4 type zinc finger TraR family protein
MGFMDGTTMEQIRELLFQRWKRQLDHQSAGRDFAPEEMLPQAEIIDMAQSLEQLGRDTSLKEQERRELLALERALAKLSSGNFGTCEDCGEEIPPKRLMVLPEARLCAHCQTYAERQNARMRPVG